MVNEHGRVGAEHRGAVDHRLAVDGQKSWSSGSPSVEGTAVLGPDRHRQASLWGSFRRRRHGGL